jgi:hypothetical protein
MASNNNFLARDRKNKQPVYQRASDGSRRRGCAPLLTDLTAIS